MASYFGGIEGGVFPWEARAGSSPRVLANQILQLWLLPPLSPPLMCQEGKLSPCSIQVTTETSHCCILPHNTWLHARQLGGCCPRAGVRSRGAPCRQRCGVEVTQRGDARETRGSYGALERLRMIWRQGPAVLTRLGVMRRDPTGKSALRTGNPNRCHVTVGPGRCSVGPHQGE